MCVCCVCCCARFTILYFVHALYWREGLRYMGSVWGGGCGRRFLGEVLQGLFIVWGLAVLSIAWCIGVTRFRDNRHNIDDILVSQDLRVGGGNQRETEAVAAECALALCGPLCE